MRWIQTVPAGAEMRLYLELQLFKHKVVTCRRGDKSSVRPWWEQKMGSAPTGTRCVVPCSHIAAI